MRRALFSGEDDGRLEKFRPYGPPVEALRVDCDGVA
jgi:hypothetical protein